MYFASSWVVQWVYAWIILPHSALSWNLSTAENLSLQDGATEWLCYPNSYLATTGQILTNFVFLPQGIKLDLKDDWNEDDLHWKTTSTYEYLSNQLEGPTQIVNLSLDDQTTLYIVWIL
jgi:hypothetical protein